MSISRYNKVYNLSLAVIILYGIVLLADVVLASVNLGSIVGISAVVFVVYSVSMLFYKIHLTRKYFLGNYAIVNLVAHGVLMGVDALLILISIFK